MRTTDSIFLVGNSVRYLAQSGRRHSYAVYAADVFGDTDTRQASTHVCRARCATPGALLAVMNGLKHTGDVPWTYGAGFETAPDELLAFTRQHPGLLGNDPKVLQLLFDPERFFALLDTLDIAYPQVSLRRSPDRPDGWLFKASGRFGGLSVQLARQRAHDIDKGYYQRFVNGRLCSLCFAADGREVRPIGFSRLLARYPAAGDFRFAGATSDAPLSMVQQVCMRQVAERLTRALSLRGVNGLDFVIDDGEPLLLELNARPPATLELYENRLPRGGLACHLDAATGRLPEVTPTSQISGMRVLYARRGLEVGSVDWPDWVSDRPSEGTRVKRDEPLCTVHAVGTDGGAVEASLRQRADLLMDAINNPAEEAA